MADKTTTEQVWTDGFPQVEEGLYWVRHKENHADIDVARLRNGSLYPTDGGSMSKSHRRDWEYSGPIAPTTTEQSVEDCLKELQQVFGDGPYIRVTRQESITNWNTNGQAERTVLIQIGNWYSTPEPTCEDAMALVRRTWPDRQWHAEQAKES